MDDLKMYFILEKGNFPIWVCLEGISPIVSIANLKNPQDMGPQAPIQNSQNHLKDGNFVWGPGVPTPLVRGCVTFMWRWVHLISCSNFPCLLLAAFFLQVASTIAASPLDVAGCWQECNLDGMKKSQRQRRRWCFLKLIKSWDHPKK